MMATLDLMLIIGCKNYFEKIFLKVIILNVEETYRH